MIVSAKREREPAKKVVKIENADEVCLEPDGFFPDSKQCDKYYACRFEYIKSIVFAINYTTIMLLEMA